MQYRIQALQDYSNRFAGSWGDIIVFAPHRVDFFLAKGNRTVVVEHDDDTPITGSMSSDEWRVWKECHNPM